MATRPCWVEIDTSALQHNYRLLRSLAGPHIDCMAVVKADAYGHGLGICAPALVDAGTQWLGVTSVEEGVVARAACPTARILIMSGLFPGQGEAVITHRLVPSVWEQWQIAELETAARNAGLAPGSLAVHLEVDTGMSRQGVRVGDLSAFAAQFPPSSPLRVQALMTHLYASDEAHSTRTPAQLAKMDEALQCLKGKLAPEWLSLGASAALIGGETSEVAALAARWHLRPMLRIGLALYGVAPRFTPAFPPSGEPAPLRDALRNLRPVLNWKSRVASVRAIAPGDEIGYNGTFVASEPMRVALVAAGYADGLDRKLGNRFRLLVRGKTAPLVGRVSMDQCTIDVTEIDGVQPGDEVVLIGSQNSETISACDHAGAAGTIPWEVFTRIGSRVPRLAQ